MCHSRKVIRVKKHHRVLSKFVVPKENNEFGIFARVEHFRIGSCEVFEVYARSGSHGGIEGHFTVVTDPRCIVRVDRDRENSPGRAT